MAFADNTTGGRVIVATGPVTKLTLKASSPCSPGDLIGYSAGWVRADADGGIPAEWVAIGASNAGGEEISVCKSCTIDFGTGSTATAADNLYLSNTAGRYTATAPTNAQLVGDMASAQVGRIELGTVKPFTALTQSYTTTATTLSSSTAANVGTTAPTNSTPYGWASSAQAAAIPTQINLMQGDIANLTGVVNTLINVLRSQGLVAP